MVLDVIRSVEMHYIIFKGQTWRERACFEGLHCFGRSPPRSGCLQPLVELISHYIVYNIKIISNNTFYINKAWVSATIGNNLIEK